MTVTATAKRRRRQARLVKGRKLRKLDLMLQRYLNKKKSK